MPADRNHAWWYRPDVNGINGKKRKRKKPK